MTTQETTHTNGATPYGIGTGATAGVLEAALEALISPMVKRVLANAELPSTDLAPVNATLEMLTDVVTTISDKVGALEARTEPTTVVIKRPDTPEITRKTVHYQYPAILALINSGISVWFFGPKGSGKTTAGLHACSDLGLPEYRLLSFNKMSTKTDLLGYMSATGSYVSGPLYDCMVNGWPLLIDEADAGNAAVGTVINAAIANRECLFPNSEMVKAHKDFRVIAFANTQGTGANSEYTGRDRLDAATLDRFFQYYVGYDWSLALNICNAGGEIDLKLVAGAFGKAQKPVKLEECSDTVLNMFLVKVGEAASKLEKKNIIHYCTPRAAILGVQALKAGIPMEQVIQGTIMRGLTDAQRADLSF